MHSFTVCSWFAMAEMDGVEETHKSRWKGRREHRRRHRMQRERNWNIVVAWWFVTRCECFMLTSALTKTKHTQLQWRPVVVCNVWWMNVENNLLFQISDEWKISLIAFRSPSVAPLAKNLKVENDWPNDMANWSVYAWTKSNEWMNDNCTQIIHVSVWLCCKLSCSLVGCVCRRVIMITDGKLQIKWIEWEWEWKWNELLCQVYNLRVARQVLSTLVHCTIAKHHTIHRNEFDECKWWPRFRALHTHISLILSTGCHLALTHTHTHTHNIVTD